MNNYINTYSYDDKFNHGKNYKFYDYKDSMYNSIYEENNKLIDVYDENNKSWDDIDDNIDDTTPKYLIG